VSAGGFFQRLLRQPRCDQLTAKPSAQFCESARKPGQLGHSGSVSKW
jgi:hypothetical protein